MSSISLQSLFKTLSQRMPWPVASRLLAQTGIQPGRGRDATLGKLKDAKGIQDQTNQFHQFFREHLVASEKSLRLYNASSTDKNKIHSWLVSKKSQLGDPTNNYLIDNADVQRMPISAPELIAVESFEDGIAGIFMSVRSTEIREPIDKSILASDIGTDLTKFREIIGIRIEKQLQFDVVWASHDGGPVDIRVDNPAGSTMEAETGAHQALQSYLHSQFEKEVLSNPINFFPLIDSIYKDKSEGVVIELGFATSTGSIKNERMRRSHSCLRKEIYHKAGSAALMGQIEPFRISVRWQIAHSESFTSYPELSLFGNTRMLHSTKPVLFEAAIRDCAGVTDFEFVRGRIRHHLDIAS